MIRTILWLIACMLLLADAGMHVLAGNAGDKEWLLLAERMVMDGKKIYVDVFEVNPPLVLWLYSIPIWLSSHLGFIKDYQILGIVGLIACATVMMLSQSLIKRHPGFAGNARKQQLFALLLACTVMFFTTQVYFFDRDHIFYVLIFPYILRFMPSLSRLELPKSVCVIIAVMAGIGFCIKPHTAIVFVLLQLLQIRQCRSAAVLWSLENGIILFLTIIYLLCAWHFAPDYFTTVLPMSLATYSGFSRRINGYLFVAIAFISAGLSFAEFRPRFRTPYRADVYYFIGVSTSFLIYALTGNGWGYSYNPLLCTLLFLCGWLLFEYVWLRRQAREKGGATYRFTSAMVACGINLSANAGYMLLCLWAFYSNPCNQPGRCGDAGPYAAYIQKHRVKSFSSMSMNLRRWSSLARTENLRWDTRFNHLWMLPSLVNGSKEYRIRHQWIIDYLGEAYAQDLKRYDPDIVFVDKSDGIFNHPYPVDIPSILSLELHFAEVWSQYRYVAMIDDCPKSDLSHAASGQKKEIHIDCRFAVYSRRPQ